MSSFSPTIYIKEYNYLLPQERIADFPLAERDQSKLLVYKSGNITDDTFVNLPQHLPDNSPIILNNTRVIEARIFFKKPTGGVIEIFCLEPFESSVETAMTATAYTQWKCLIGGASKWKPGQVLHKEIQLSNALVGLSARYIAKKEDDFIIQFEWEPTSYMFADILHAAGVIPLPPYIKRTAGESDADRYQTIFAKHQGSVAAPTAALHFTDTVFAQFAKKNITTGYVTLHVGAGTFKPVKTDTIQQHQMHQEQFSVTLDFLKWLQQASNVIVVGTTSLRTVESLHWLGVKLAKNPLLSITDFNLTQWEAYELRKNNIPYKESLQQLINKMQELQISQLYCQTSLLIVPGYEFQVPVALVTNFHQPQSTLLLLIAAFIGDDWKKIYAHALENNYRFLSYGDSSLLWRKD